MSVITKEKRYRQASSGSLKNGCVHDSKTLQTTDATATAIYSIPVAANTAIAYRAIVVGKISDSSASYASVVSGGARRASGNVAAVGSVTVTAVEDSAGTPAVTVAANTSTQCLDIKVAGISAETWNWEIFVEYIDA